MERNLKHLEEAFWYITTGREFKDAYWFLIEHFNAIAEEWVEQVEKPSYYCAGLAIEHFLKAHYELMGVDAPRGEKSHDLANLLEASPGAANYFELSVEDVQQIRLLNRRYYSDEEYGKHDLRYPSKSGPRTSPHPDALSGLLGRMSKRLDNLEAF